MSFYDKVTRAKSLLREQGPVSASGLMREFSLDKTGVEQLIEELVDVQQVAVRNGQVLAWAGDAATTPKLVPRETPKHLADKILQSKSVLEGERKQVTLLFADVKGSMDLAEQFDPEEWRAIMQRFFQILSDGVERFEGYVDTFTGGGGECQGSCRL